MAMIQGPGAYPNMRQVGMYAAGRMVRQAVDDPMGTARGVYHMGKSIRSAIKKQLDRTRRQRREKRRSAAKGKRRAATSSSTYVPSAKRPRVHVGVPHAGKYIRTVGAVGAIGRGKRPKIPKDRATVRVDKVETHKQSEVLWVGYKSFDRAQMFKLIARRLYIKMFRRMGIEVMSGDKIPDEFNNTDGGWMKIVWRYDPINVQDAGIGVNVAVQADSKILSQDFDNSLNVLSAALAADMQSRARAGFVLTNASVYVKDATGGGTETSQLKFVVKQLNAYKLDVNVRTLYKIHNTTPGDDGGTTTTDISANPLNGCLYDFSHPSPRFRQQFLNEKGGKGFSILQSTADDLDVIDTSCFRTADTYSSSLDNTFQQPDIRPSVMFKDCVQKTNVYMNPGGFTTLTRTFKFSGRLDKLMLGLYHSAGVKTGVTYEAGGTAIADSDVRTLASTGESILLALDHTIRTKAATSEYIEVVINREQTYTCDMQAPKIKPVVRETVVSGVVHYGVA